MESEKRFGRCWCPIHTRPPSAAVTTFSFPLSLPLPPAPAPLPLRRVLPSFLLTIAICHGECPAAAAAAAVHAFPAIISVRFLVARSVGRRPDVARIPHSHGSCSPPPSSHHVVHVHALPFPPSLAASCPRPFKFACAAKSAFFGE